MTSTSTKILGGLLAAVALVAMVVGLSDGDAPVSTETAAVSEPVEDDITAGLPELPLPDIEDVATISTPAEPGALPNRAALREEMRAYLLENPEVLVCLLYTSPSPRDRTRSRMPSSA